MHSAPVNRRSLIASCTGLSFGSLALQALEADNHINPLQPLAPRLPAAACRARQIIFLFQYGGPSSFDLLDYKPQLQKLHGQPVPASIREQQDRVGGVFQHCRDELMAGPWRWQQHGQNGQWVSELLPHTARHIDRLCQIRSM
ncbi:MAG: DUF1501 domain-containing protein, partial [Planctomycetaceae bacterium]